MCVCTLWKEGICVRAGRPIFHTLVGGAGASIRSQMNALFCGVLCFVSGCLRAEFFCIKAAEEPEAFLQALMQDWAETVRGAAKLSQRAQCSLCRLSPGWQ